MLARFVQCAAELGLSFKRPLRLPFEGASFKRRKRAMGIPIPLTEASTDDWLHGLFQGHEVALRLVLGKGQSDQRAHLVARIDPPLFLGLVVARFDGVEQALGIGLKAGHGPFDSAFRVEAFDADRARALLRPLAPAMLALVRSDLRVTDTTAELFAPLELGAIVSALGSLTWLARALSQGRAELPETARERAQRAEWARFADVRGLMFDPVRMDMQGLDLRVCLDGELGRILTLASIGTAEHTGTFVHMSPRVLVGYPPERLARALERPGVAQALARGSRWGREVEISDRDVLVRARSSMPSAADLDAFVREVSELASLLSGDAGVPAGPYR